MEAVESRRPLAIYKPGQGYWTRMLSAVGAGTILLSGCLWLNNVIKSRLLLNVENNLYIAGGIALAIFFVLGGLLWWLMNKPNIVDFMISTEAEMKKVNWPSRKEVMGSTVVVIAGTFIMAGVLFVADIFFSWLFTTMNVLKLQ